MLDRNPLVASYYKKKMLTDLSESMTVLGTSMLKIILTFTNLLASYKFNFVLVFLLRIKIVHLNGTCFD